MAYRFSDQSGSAYSGSMQIQALQQLKDGNTFSDTFRRLYDDWPVPSSWWQSAPTDTCPQAWGWRIGTNLHVLVYGSTQLSHFAAHNETWRRDYDRFDVPKFTRLHAANGKELWTKLVASGLTDGLTAIRICGHSLGGSTACALAVRARAFISCPIYIHTFGAAKCLRAGYEDLGRTITLTRWFNSDDPVPPLPPNQGNALLFYELLTDQEKASMNSWSHPLGGAMLGPNGAVSWTEQNANGNTSTLTDLTRWLSTMAGSADNMHSIGEYVRRLIIASTDQLDAGVPQEPTPQVQEQTITPVPSIVEPTRQMVMQAMNVAVTQSAPPPPPRVPGVKAIKIKPWVRKRNGSLYEIYHNGELVGVTPSKGKAGNAVIQGNQLDRALARVATQTADPMAS